ncbi:alpha/beta hydrolase [Shewanella canadensis]|uniref:alpha/beta hydrolase n=1 Tax=Shewanella canadensis TaxID=271096 RepID=UPI00163AE32D|nr:alpha/beta fold hydrolase [Shewanella canadensis]
MKGSITSTLATLLFLYLGICLLLFVLQRKLLYFPTPPLLHFSPPMEATVTSFENEGERLSGWVVNEGHPKALLYYGGNAENIENNIPFFRENLPDYTVYLIAYRGYGDSSGEPTEAHLYSDALQIFDEVTAEHTTLSLLGRSLGSGVATYVAAHREVDKLILVTPFDSTANVAKSVYWMFPVSLLITDKYESAKRASNIDAKTTIIYAENDTVIPRASTERLIDAFSGQLEDTMLIRDADHNDISEYSEYVTGLKRALD